MAGLHGRPARLALRPQQCALAGRSRRRAAFAPRARAGKQVIAAGRSPPRVVDLEFLRGCSELA